LARPEEGPPTVLEGIGGTSEPNLQFTSCISVQEDGTEVKILVTKLPTGISLILGKDWLYGCGAVIDTKCCEVRLDHVAIPCDFRPKAEPDACAELCGSVCIKG